MFDMTFQVSWDTVIASIALVLGIEGLVDRLRSGTLKMPRPSMVSFVQDPDPNGDSCKIVMDFTLYSTGTAGIIVESLYARVSWRGGSTQPFNVWWHGTGAQLNLGSGLFVGKQGVAERHQFLLPRRDREFDFKKDRYMVEVFAKSVEGRWSKFIPKMFGQAATRLFSESFEVTDQQASELKLGIPVIFNRDPESNTYHPQGREQQVRKQIVAPPSATEVLKGYVVTEMTNNLILKDVGTAVRALVCITNTGAFPVTPSCVVGHVSMDHTNQGSCEKNWNTAQLLPGQSDTVVLVFTLDPWGGSETPSHQYMEFGIQVVADAPVWGGKQTAHLQGKVYAKVEDRRTKSK